MHLDDHKRQNSSTIFLSINGFTMLMWIFSIHSVLWNWLSDRNGILVLKSLAPAISNFFTEIPLGTPDLEWYLGNKNSSSRAVRGSSSSSVLFLYHFLLLFNGPIFWRSLQVTPVPQYSLQIPFRIAGWRFLQIRWRSCHPNYSLKAHFRNSATAYCLLSLIIKTHTLLHHNRICTWSNALWR